MNRKEKQMDTTRTARIIGQELLDVKLKRENLRLQELRLLALEARLEEELSEKLHTESD